MGHRINGKTFSLSFTYIHLSLYAYIVDIADANYLQCDVILSQRIQIHIYLRFHNIATKSI